MNPKPPKDFKPPQICPVCDKPTPWTTIPLKQDQIIKGKTITVTSPALRCRNCELTILSTEQANELIRRTNYQSVSNQ